VLAAFTGALVIGQSVMRAGTAARPGTAARTV
jgi:hypothetical protein